MVSGSKKLILSLLVLLLSLGIPQIFGQIQSGTGLNVSESWRQVDNTVRVDPLNSLKKYRGGYDITNKHYWSSTAYTGIPGYVLGVLWLLCGLVFGIFLLVTTYCCTISRKLKKTRKSPHLQRRYLYHIYLATFFTLLTIVGTGLVLGGNAKFHSRAKTVVDLIIDTADDASETIYKTTGAMKDMSSNLDAANAAGVQSRFLSSTSLRLDSRAADIQRQARKNRSAIHKGLEILYIVTTVIISVNLLAVIALSVLGLLKLRQPLHLLIIFCWLVTVICWFFFGTYFFIGKFAGDTCTALEDFQQNPYNNSLSEILPCDQLLSAQSVLSDVSSGVYHLVNQVNANISRMQGRSSFFHICNPFSPPPHYNFQPDNCSPNAVRIGDIPQLLKLITCVDAENGICNGGIPISGRDFRAIEAYTRSIQTLLNVYPGMESLVECQTVKDTFSTILDKHCNPLKRNVRLVWGSMVFLSTVMVALLLTWSIRAYHDRKHQFSNGSIKPHAATDSEIDKEPTMITEDINGFIEKPRDFDIEKI